MSAPRLSPEVSVRPRLHLCIVFLAVFALPSFAQRGNPKPQSRTDVTQPPADEDELRTRVASDMAKKAAKERVAALKIDTDRLLKLSVELKSYVDKSDENVLSLDVIKKAEEIEKLARSVKEKMKGPN